MRTAQTIAIIGAMDLEIESLKEKLADLREEKTAGVTFYSGKLCGRKVVLAVCGIGKVSAAACAQAAILRYRPAAVINVGVAGTLTNDLSIGDIAVGKDAVCHDMDTTALGDPAGYISGLGLVKIPLSEELSARFLKICREKGINALSGTIASGDQFICEKGKKEWISSFFGAVACEMEGQAIAQVCFMNGVPCAVLRSISDSADEGAAQTDYEQFKRFAAERSSEVLCAFLSEKA